MTQPEQALAAEDIYAALAPIYDEWQERYGAFWKAVLPRLEGIGPSFLDLGCGTGSLLVALRRSHPDWRLCGLDGSAAMLDHARRKTDTITWIHGGFETPVPGTFAAAGAFFDALNHAHQTGALGRICTAVARALVPGGLFLFDLNNELGFSTWWQTPRAYVGPGWILQMEAGFDAATRLGHGRASIDRRGHGRATTEVTERCYADDEVRAALDAAGFTVEATEPWSPRPNDVPGKTWWIARRLR